MFQQSLCAFPRLMVRIGHLRLPDVLVLAALAAFLSEQAWG